MQNKGLNRQNYLQKNVGDYSDTINVNNVNYTKVSDLRYGTNPHQSAAFYKVEGKVSTIGEMKTIKDGKNGLSQTNLEDISYALNICKFFKEATCVVMKHVNPSGVAIANNATLAYTKARDADPRAAFGSTIAFNVEVDQACASEIMTSFVECVVAPSFTKEAKEEFISEKYKINKHIRLLECASLDTLPKYVGDTSQAMLKSLIDGSLILADPLLTYIRDIKSLPKASASKKDESITSEVTATDSQLKDLLLAWYINLSVRSNGVVIVKNQQSLSIGTGEQDRVGAIEQAITKFDTKYMGEESLENSVMASDGFFPFYDGVEVAAKAGVRAIIAPAGSIKDYEVIKRCNELNVALIHAPERCFSHH